MSQRVSRRALHHAVLASASIVVCVLLRYVIGVSDATQRLSLASAYVAVVLLATTLIIGPVNSLRGARQPVSSNFRRDFGIWACVWSIVHTVVGLNVHLRGRMLEYFFRPGSESLLSRARHDLFGAANYSGLLATLLVVFLALLSNDASLRSLGAERWKRLQKLNYVLFAITILHAVLCQLIEKRQPWGYCTIGFLAALVLTLQAVRAVTRKSESRQVLP
jgi:sulfoxide reductase heme-binding subunit YedZ